MPTINTSTLTTINKDTDGVWTSTTCTAAIDYDGDITDGDPCKFASSGVYRDQNGAGDCFYCSGYTQTEVRTLVHEDSSTTTQTTVYAKILLQFEEEGGSAVSDKYIYYGGGRTFGTLPTNTTRAGYTLAGWYTAATGGTEVLSSTEVTSTDLVQKVYAQWNPITYNIAFDANTGTGTMASMTNLDYGETYTLTANAFTKDHYYFIGWAPSPGSSVIYNDQDSVSNLTTTQGATITLYATWAIENYCYVFNTNGGTTISDLCYDYGATVSAPNNPSRTGYTFGGWFSNSNLTTQFTFPSTMPDYGNDGAQVQLYAKWNAVNYNITYVLNGGTNNPSNPSTYTIEDSITLQDPSKTRTGYTCTFDGWSPSDTISLGSTGNKTFTATWTETANDYTVTFDSNGGSTPSPQTKIVTFDSTYGTLPTVTRTGYTFSTWNTLSSGLGTNINENSTVSIGNNHTLYGKWTANSYTVYLSPESNTADYITAVYDSAMPSQGVNSVEDGALVNPPVTVTLSAPTQSGYTFGGYYSGQNGTGTQYYTNTMSSARTWNIATNNTTLYGKFTPITYTITYNLNGGTNNGSNPSTYTVESSTITFAAPTRTGYTFGGWYSNSALTTSKSQITSGSTGNVEVWAKWTIESYSIVTVENGGTTVDNFTGNYGDSITAPADPTRTGYTFEGWFSNIALTTAFTFPSTFPDYGADGTTVNVYAKWTAITYEVAYNGNTNTGGSMTNSTHTYDVAKQLTANAFTKTNYSFQGWATSSGGAVVYSNQQSVTNLRSSSGTYNLYAKWRGVASTLSYNTNSGGSVAAPGSKTIYYNETYGTLPTLSRTGYTFNGWFTASSGGTQITSSTTVTVTSNQTLYAQWTIINYTISYTLNGGTNSGSNPSTYNIESATITFADPTRTGYTFSSWSLASIPSGSTGNKSTTASWTANQYTATFQTYRPTITSGGIYIIYYTKPTYDSPMPTGSGFTSDNTERFGTLTKPDRVGYNFQGYYTGSNGGGTQYYTSEMNSSRSWNLTANTTMIPYFTPKTTTVTLDKNGGSGGTTTVTATYDANMPTATAPTRSGYVFLGYYDAASGGTQYYTSTMASARTWNKINTTFTLEAQWQEITATPTTSFSGSTSSNISFRITNQDAASVTATYEIREGSATGTIKASGTTSSISSGTFGLVGYNNATASTTYYLTGVRATATGKVQSGLATNASGSTTAQQSQTDTPTINSLSCEQIGSTYYLSASIKNNDASSVTMEASRSSNFMPKVTSSYTGGQTKTITVSTSSSSFDGTQTVYARATASGETLSNSTSKTQSVSCGGLGGFG